MAAVFRINIDRISPDGPLALELRNGDPVFVVGPNGAGKSALINRAAAQVGDRARVVWAHRQTWLNDSAVTLTAYDRLRQEPQVRTWDRSPNARWRDAHCHWRPLAALFDLVRAETARAQRIAQAVDKANGERDLKVAQELARSDQKPIARLNEMFRAAELPIEIEMTPAQEILARKHSSAPYPVSELSDGERNALLLAADVLGAEEGKVILIDEPERHLHRAITAPLLTELFAARPDCAFLVATHDLSLVMENRGRRVLLLRDCRFGEGGRVEWDLDVLEGEADIPDDVKRMILGARRVLLFVEGTQSSRDQPLYRILFTDVTVYPCGSAEDVIKTVRSLRKVEHLHWVRAFGIVDRDHRGEEETEDLRQEGIHPLAVSTVEALSYHPRAIALVANHQAKTFGCDASNLAAEAVNAALDELRRVPPSCSSAAVDPRSSVRSSAPSGRARSHGSPT